VRKQVSGVAVYGEIGFVNNILDTAALTTFADNATNGDVFVRTWFDQSGSSNDASQTTTSAQPQIITSGVINLDNSKPSLSFNGTTSYLRMGNLTSISNLSVINVCNPISYLSDATNSRFYDIKDGTNTFQFVRNASSGKMGLKNTFFQSYTGTDYESSVTGQSLFSNLFLASSNSHYLDGSSESNTGAVAIGEGGTLSTIGKRGDLVYSTSFYGFFQEIIIYKSNQSSNISAINININNFYSIY
jgi:hypothetical protein